MYKKTRFLTACVLLSCVLATGCSGNGVVNQNEKATDTVVQNEKTNEDMKTSENIQNRIVLTSEIKELEKGLSAVRFEGNDNFEDFLNAGGASSDADVIKFLSTKLLADIDIDTSQIFGCSTIAVTDENGNHLFGRNFDWDSCDALVVVSKPEQGYASVSTVNTNFITANAGFTVGLALKKDEIMTLASLYAPLDGMNEAGFGISVNMISDSASIEQDTNKPDLTTTTAVRMLLNKAATVDEAITLLKQYDLHGSMGMMVHFAMTDTTGKSVVVEYIGNEMSVVETPIVTNFYLTEGEKYGIGTSQSHARYETLENTLEQKKTMNRFQVRDTLDSVSKHNFDEYESTEWSAVFQLDEGVVDYYHRENYTKSYTIAIEN
ncbi:hypothetical protein P261_02483 [Lachnospiraceae bacterium TWA4]|nr:hypothetical protein P261_02483 [Lachnospiraceae bacterium TWA4]